MLNNQVEYKALIMGLALAKDMRTTRVDCKTDSQLVVRQINGTFQVKDDQLLQYNHKSTQLIKGFEVVNIEHIPRMGNAKADVLFKLANGKVKGQLSIVI